MHSLAFLFVFFVTLLLFPGINPKGTESKDETKLFLDCCKKNSQNRFFSKSSFKDHNKHDYGHMEESKSKVLCRFPPRRLKKLLNGELQDVRRHFGHYIACFTNKQDHTKCCKDKKLEEINNGTCLVMV